MANVYPFINAAHIITQFDYMEEDEYNTQQSTVEAGFSVGRPYNDTPLKRFTLSYPLIQRAEVTVIEDFFKSMRGRLGQFTFTDDAGNMWINTRFDMDEIQTQYNAVQDNAIATVKLSATLNSFVPFDPNLGDEGSDSGPTPQTQET